MMRIYFTLMFGLVLACSGLSKEEQKLYDEAAAIHNEAVGQASKLNDQLKKMETDSLIAQDSIVALQAALQAWSEDLIEVPGNDEHHHHGEDEHHHDHSRKGDISAQEMLAVQQELKARLVQIEARISNLAEAGKK